MSDVGGGGGGGGGVVVVAAALMLCIFTFKTTYTEYLHTIHLYLQNERVS